MLLQNVMWFTRTLCVTCPQDIKLERSDCTLAYNAFTWINPFPNKPWFSCVCSPSLLKTTSNFSFPTVFSTHLENFLPCSSNLKLSSANSFVTERNLCISIIFHFGRFLLFTNIFSFKIFICHSVKGLLAKRSWGPEKRIYTNNHVFVSVRKIGWSTSNKCSPHFLWEMAAFQLLNISTYSCNPVPKSYEFLSTFGEALDKQCGKKENMLVINSSWLYPRKQSLGGVYWNQPVSRSVGLSAKSCPDNSSYSFSSIHLILGRSIH